MQCIYFLTDTCYANPSIPVLVAKYKPEEETKNKFCKTGEFLRCPRFEAMQEYLKAMHGKR